MASRPPLHIGWVNNPEAVAGLSRARPDPEQHPVLVGEYNVRPNGGRKNNPDGPRTWCCHCQGARHWHGFVVADDEGRYFLIGRHCGAKHYGADRFRAAKRSFDAIEVQRAQDRRLIAIAESANAIINEVQTLLASPELAAIEAKRQELENASPQAAERLATLARSGLSLTTHEQLRGGGFVSVDLGQVEGASLIYSDIRFCCRNLLEAMTCAAILPQSAERQEKANSLKRLDECLRSTLEASENCAQAHRFFLRRNLVRLSRWSVPMRRFYTLSVDGKNLVVQDAARGVASVTPLMTRRMPPLAACKQFMTNKSGIPIA